MPDFSHIAEQLAVVAAAPIPFAVAILVVLFVMWWAIDWSYRAIISSKNAQIELLERQVDDYKVTLHGASPDEAKARIDALEKKLRDLEPDRIVGDARLRLIDLLKTSGKNFSVAIHTEMIGNNSPLATDLADAFRKAGWSVSEANILGAGDKPPSGLAVSAHGRGKLWPEASIVTKALTEIGIAFDLYREDKGSDSIVITVCN